MFLTSKSYEMHQFAGQNTQDKVYNNCCFKKLGLY